ncbi:MAG: nitroreductase [Sphingomicrobium sp.]
MARDRNGQFPLVKRIVGAAERPYLPTSMLNDRSSILSLLETRRSGKPRELIGPGPTAEELERILSIAARTPDHGKLFPWRFVTVAEDQRDELAILFRRALAKEDECAPPAKHEKADEFAHYAGQLIVLISAPTPDHKIPIWEQELSCGAVGMNLLLGAHALGYVAGWVTGWYAYSDHVREAFCKEGERIAGFIFIGDASRDLAERPRAPLDLVWKSWKPPAF